MRAPDCSSSSPVSRADLPAVHARQRAPAVPARRVSLLAFAASLLVAGCGQRGPLYLPENAPPPRRTRPAAQGEAEESSR